MIERPCGHESWMWHWYQYRWQEWIEYAIIGKANSNAEFRFVFPPFCAPDKMLIIFKDPIHETHFNLTAPEYITDELVECARKAYFERTAGPPAPALR